MLAALAKLAAAIAFYTSLPVPAVGALDFRSVAQCAPLVGLLIGGLLAGVDWGAASLGLPPLTRSALVVVTWVALTGGLHLDGVMDTADGLAVPAERRLAVMADSHSGAFGVMAAIALLLLKTAALSDLHQARWVALLLAPGWGRWGQQVAIVQYPYLKPAGKGAFHKAALPSQWWLLPGGALMLTVTGLGMASGQISGIAGAIAAFGGMLFAIAIPAWFARKLGGHTGDTYGAVVEWTEVMVLILLLLCGGGAIAAG
ncbi:MAG: adenosylcobinamide-GDP ribazoletransferase [Synechococcales bacterium]|nr:adenosylcobinamide-GDP ribazoletransferase [Synechococcales bacterium]